MDIELEYFFHAESVLRFLGNEGDQNLLYVLYYLPGILIGVILSLVSAWYFLRRSSRQKENSRSKDLYALLARYLSPFLGGVVIFLYFFFERQYPAGRNFLDCVYEARVIYKGRRFEYERRKCSKEYKSVWIRRI